VLAVFFGEMENQYSFAAIRGVQAGRAFYVAMVPLKTLERLFRYNDDRLPAALRAQRDLNKSRIRYSPG
jgi:DNA sulfur modification protein DndB